jgi:DNA-binding NarL/FixJ family response regulator
VLQGSLHFDVVGEADDGARAVEMTDVLQPDVVLLDVGMPRMDGPTALAGLLAAGPRTKVIVLSGMNERVVLPLLEAGAAGFVPKGIPPLELLERLDSILDHPVVVETGPGATGRLPAGGPSPTRVRPRAVICDDDPMARRLASEVLEHCDVEVVAETDTVADLLSVVGLTHPDLVVLDLWLEGTPGTSAPPTIRALSPQTLVVIFSAYEEWGNRAVAAGAAAFVAKPNFDALAVQIRRLVRAVRP